MDLNRDLPPLPLTTDSQSLRIGDQSQQHSLELQVENTFGLLQPLFYDPVRDSLKYGGLHYHPDGMLYHPKVPQHPPRTSSMPQTETLLKTAGGFTNGPVVTGEHLCPPRAANTGSQDMFRHTCASDASYESKGSSGIMGNFIPVKTVPSSSMIVARAVHLPRIEYISLLTAQSLKLTANRTGYSMLATGHKAQLKTTYEKGPLQE
jgi:hypothetical protein